MDINPKPAAAKSEQGGQTYYFCSTDCKQKFDQNPQAYTAKKEAVRPRA
jgi:YHS domain-containing protein